MYSSYLLVRWIILVSYHLFTKRLYVSLTVFKIIKNIKSLCVKLKISISVCYMVRAQRCKNKKVARDLPHHYSICNYIHVLYRHTDFKLQHYYQNILAKIFISVHFHCHRYFVFLTYTNNGIPAWLATKSPVGKWTPMNLTLT